MRQLAEATPQRSRYESVGGWRAPFDQSHRRIVSAVVTLVLVLANSQAGLGQPGDAPPADNVFVAKKNLPILGVGAADTNRFKLEFPFEGELNLDEDLKAFLTEDGLNWDPSEALKSFRLDSRLPEQSGLRSLRVGKVGDDDIDVEVEYSADSIKLSDPVVRMVFRVIRPERIQIGVYSGNLPIRFTNPKLEPKGGFVLSIPIVLYSFGRVLEDPRFMEPVGRVGAPASVVVTVLTIGDKMDLGSGKLLLNYHPLVGDPQPGVRLRLPLPDKEPIVPRYDKRFGAASEESVPTDNEAPPAEEKDSSEFWAHARWRDSALWQHRPKEESVSKAAGLAIPSDLVKRHRLEIHLPDSFSLGDWKTKVEWEPGRKADAGTPATLTRSAESKINPGLLIQHHSGWVGDRFKLHAVSARPVGETLLVTVTYPDKQTTANISLKRTPPKGDADASATLTTYVGEFPERSTKSPTIDQSGDYTVQITGPEAIDETLKSPVKFQTCFRINTRPIQQHPELTIFASPVPLDVWLLRTPYSGDPWRTSFEEAFSVSFNSELLGSAMARSLRNYRVIASGNHSVRQPITDPLAEITLDVAPIADVDKDGNVHLQAGKNVPWKISAEISETDNSPNAPRLQLGSRQFEHHVLLTGRDVDGNLRTRIWWVPVRVRIDRDWEHYKYFVVLLVVLGLVALAAGVFWLSKRYAKSMVRPAADLQAPVSTTDDFFADTPSPSTPKTGSPNDGTDSPTAVPKKPRAKASPPKAAPPPASKPDDDWANW